MFSMYYYNVGMSFGLGHSGSQPFCDIADAAKQSAATGVDTDT